MNNLIKNSLQSMPNDVLPNIKIKIESKNKSTFIKIIDNGFGIPLDLQSKIFEPKFTTKNSGMGLGLGIVKNIIESHGGIISFTSTVKKGTTFLIELKNLKF